MRALLSVLLLLVPPSGDYNNSGISRENEATELVSDEDQWLRCPAGTQPRIKEALLRGMVRDWYAGHIESSVIDVKQWPVELHYPKRTDGPYEAGQVVVTLFIETDGSVASTVVACSSDEIFDASASEYGGRFVFQPPLKDGRPARSTAHQPVLFNP